MSDLSNTVSDKWIREHDYCNRDPRSTQWNPEFDNRVGVLAQDDGCFTVVEKGGGLEVGDFVSYEESKKYVFSMEFLDFERLPQTIMFIGMGGIAGLVVYGFGRVVGLW